MSTEQAALTAFESVAPPEPDPSGLDAIAADLAPEDLQQHQTDDASDRVVNAETCSRCKGQHPSGECPELGAERDLVDDPLRAPGGGR